MLEAAVGRFDGTVRGSDIEVGQHVVAQMPQWVSLLSELLLAFRQPLTQVMDDPFHELLACDITVLRLSTLG